MPDKYRITTDQGTYEVTTESGEAPPVSPPPQKDTALTTVGDLAKGFVKSAGRSVQAIPGVTAATDWAYGLPKGASEASMQPTNTAQKFGGYAEDAIELGVPVAEGLRSVMGVASLRQPVGQVIAKIGEYGGKYDITKPVKPLGDAAKFIGQQMAKPTIPEAKSMIDVITKSPKPVNVWESNFLMDIHRTLTNGQKLSGAQGDVLQRIYKAMK